MRKLAPVPMLLYTLLIMLVLPLQAKYTLRITGTPCNPEELLRVSLLLERSFRMPG